MKSIKFCTADGSLVLEPKGLGFLFSHWFTILKTLTSQDLLDHMDQAQSHFYHSLHWLQMTFLLWARLKLAALKGSRNPKCL